jgi:nitrate reductase NapE component
MGLSSLLERLSAVSPVVLPVLLDAAVKGLALLTLTALATLALRRASAATRHLIWFLGTLGLLIVPILSIALPGWYILPRWMVQTAPPTRVQPAAAPTGAPAVVPHSPNAKPVSNDALRAEAVATALVSSTAAPLPARLPSPLRLTWQAGVLVAWLAGAGLLLGGRTEPWER